MASRSALPAQPPAFLINSGPFCPLLLCEFIRLLRQRVQALLIRNLVAKCSQLAFILQRLIFMRQQGFLLCRQLATLRRLLQYRELTLRLPQIPALLADFLIRSGMLLQRPEVSA